VSKDGDRRRQVHAIVADLIRAFMHAHLITNLIPLVGLGHDAVQVEPGQPFENREELTQHVEIPGVLVVAPDLVGI